MKRSAPKTSAIKTSKGKLDRLGIARALRETARLLELAGGPMFKARAYDRAARALERLGTDLGRLVSEGRLVELHGIGPRLAAVISEFYLTGSSKALEKLRSQYPPGASELSRIPELSLARIRILSAAGIETLSQLKEACEKGRLRAVKGIGERAEQQILERLQRLEGPARVLLPEAGAAAEELLAYLRQAPGAVATAVAGDLRRWTETVERLVLVLASTKPAAAASHVRSAPFLSVENPRGLAVLGTLPAGLPVEVRVVAPRSYPTEMLFATGAPAHVEHLRRMAGKRGLTLTPSGVARLKRPEPVSIETEADVYGVLALPLIPPELREDEGEIEAAARGTLPDDLVDQADIRGMVHCHTVYSDGRHTVEQMAKAAAALGMEYMTLTDHSPAASYAGGLSVDRLKAQWEEIARVQESVPVRLLRGSEVDILADGALDYPDSVLEQLDIVIASVHRRFRLDAEQMTRRLTRAMSHPCFKIWGHALGRLILSRPPIDCRVEEVLDVIAASRAAVEINGDPHRLDMEPRWVRAARERGIRFVISTDAHAVGDYRYLQYGVAMARRGWVRRGEVLNVLKAPAFARAVSPAGRQA
jgi:DNA polymerase (family X)